MALQLRSAVALLDTLDIGVLALDSRSKLVALNKKARDLLACGPDGSGLPRTVLDLVDDAWRCFACTPAGWRATSWSRCTRSRSSAICNRPTAASWQPCPTVCSSG